MESNITTPGQRSITSLLQGVDCAIVSGSQERDPGNIDIVSVTSDSRNVVEGSLFVALKGVGCDGHDFILGAIASGAVAVICEKGSIEPAQLADWSCVLIETVDTAKAYGLVAANYYERPAEKLRFIGVTGTNGKTTVTYLLEQVFLDAGLRYGVIGTVNNRYVGNDGKLVVLSTRFTTPEAMVLQQLLREMVDAGVKNIIMEVSSHGLVQDRISNIKFDIAAFTNLSRDHLDYHQDMVEYLDAKLSLFSEHMLVNGVAVLPVKPAGDIGFNWHEKLIAICESHCEKIIYWGEETGADIRLLAQVSTLVETVIDIEANNEKMKIRSPLVGRYNVDNLMTVIGLCTGLGINRDGCLASLEKAVGAPGRLERVIDASDDPVAGPVVFVDYAHTPDALEQVLSTVSQLPHKELFTVFGCGGDRDNGKRAVMGEIGCRISNVAIVTDDNPRTEDPEVIIAHILEGVDQAGAKVQSAGWLATRGEGDRGAVVERDRAKAIALAITSAGVDDIVLIAGKGHETYQLTIHGRRFFDDRVVAKNVLIGWTRSRIASAVSGEMLWGSAEVELLGEVTTDSRKPSSSGIFVALKGENFDGHDFLEMAVENGATCLVVESKNELLDKSHVTQVVVKDCLQALGDLANYRRRQIANLCEQKVIGITGSCGKTTVKEMVAAILHRKWPEGVDYPKESVLKTEGNFNNLIGLPLSLLPLNLSHRVAVIEMGMNRSGELTRLAEIAEPDISCIVNVHGAHLEELHSIEGVAKAKEELFAGTKESGILVVNLDDPLVRKLAEKYRHAKVTYGMLQEGLSNNPDLWVTQVELKEPGVITFVLHYKDGEEDIHLYAAGEHNVSNALAAAAIAVSAGANLSEIAAGLADFRAPDKRMEVLKATHGFGLLNDTYNANPASMAAGLKTLRQMTNGKCVALLGDMLELGGSACEAHFQIGCLVAELKIDYVGLVGDYKNEIKNGALSCGVEDKSIILFDTKEDAASWINKLVREKNLGQDDLLLVKASRGLRFETIVTELTETTE